MSEADTRHGASRGVIARRPEAGPQSRPQRPRQDWTPVTNSCTAVSVATANPLKTLRRHEAGQGVNEIRLH